MKPNVLAMPLVIDFNTASGSMPSASPTPELTMSSTTKAGSLNRRISNSSAAMPAATMSISMRQGSWRSEDC
jgi:hypothetical protein